MRWIVNVHSIWCKSATETILNENISVTHNTLISWSFSSCRFEFIVRSVGFQSILQISGRRQQTNRRRLQKVKFYEALIVSLLLRPAWIWKWTSRTCNSASILTCAGTFPRTNRKTNAPTSNRWSLTQVINCLMRKNTLKSSNKFYFRMLELSRGQIEKQMHRHPADGPWHR